MCEQYEVEDNGCDCTEDGFDSDWEWNEEQECYICNGCGERQ